ncbi:hypothetical protein [Luteolibacter sp. LG18]|uniref:hypothetical protein n=1 Tax=Luteolibacter sp. LG18 TaxID=2819286 RepID=UPI002B2A59BC|nr:hypothetical protein llg_06180 [Luteolibacter sp. LG18]
MKRHAVAFALICGAAFAADPPKAIVAEPVAPPAPAGPEVVPAAEPPVAAPQRMVSASKQFVVVGGEPHTRGTVAMMADDVKLRLLRLSKSTDAWKIPLTILLQGQVGDPLPAKPTQFDLFFDDSGWVLQLKLHLPKGYENGSEHEKFDRAILSALLYEQALRKMPPQEMDEPLIVPPWLVAGLQETMAWKDGQSDRKLYAALDKSGGLYKLADLLAVKESRFDSLDGASRGAFRGTSGALVMALVDQPDGEEGFRQFLSEAANFGGEMPVLLKRCFPGLNLSETSLSKWLALKVKELAEPPLTESLSVADSDASLELGLKVHYRDAVGNRVERPLGECWQDLAALAPSARAEAVKQVQDDLVRLSYRCFPSYRPLLEEYQAILLDILKGKTPKTAAQLSKLADTRTTMKERARQAGDFLDWFEITRARETSGAFEDYLKLKEKLKYETPVRKDPVSSYLDLMQKSFGREEPAPKGTGR